MAARQPAAPHQIDDPLWQMAQRLETAEVALAKARRQEAEFLCALGHELRSPLTAILGFAQLMDAAGPHNQKSGLAQILQAGWGLLASIDEILDASMVECGKLPLQMEHIAIEDALRDCEVRIEPLAQRSNCHLAFAWPEAPLLVLADRVRLRQILLTLLGHSLLHSGAAGAVKVSFQSGDQGRLRVHFQDTSAGRSAAWLAHSQPAQHIKLIVSQQLAGHMGGRIATETTASTGGNASTYWLELNAAGSTS